MPRDGRGFITEVVREAHRTGSCSPLPSIREEGTTDFGTGNRGAPPWATTVSLVLSGCTAHQGGSRYYTVVFYLFPLAHPHHQAVRDRTSEDQYQQQSVLLRRLLAHLLTGASGGRDLPASFRKELLRGPGKQKALSPHLESRLDPP